MSLVADWLVGYKGSESRLNHCMKVGLVGTKHQPVKIDADMEPDF